MKKSQAKLGHALELFPSVDEFELLLELVVREALIKGHDGTLLPRRFHTYASLNASKTQVLMEIKEQLPRPKKRCGLIPISKILISIASTIMIMVTIQKSVSSSRTRSRSSFGTVGLVGSYDIDRKDRRIDR